MELTKRQAEIIDISFFLTAEKGIQNLTIKNIAKKIGISEPAIYRHFPSKFDILMTMLNSFDKIASDVLLDSNIKNFNSLEKIEYFLTDRYKRCSENQNLAKVMFSEEFFQNDERLSKKVLAIMHSHKSEIEKIINAAQVSGEIRNDIDPTSLFRIIFGAMRLLVKQWCLTNYKFNIQTEGMKLWNAQKKLIKI